MPTNAYIFNLKKIYLLGPHPDTRFEVGIYLNCSRWLLSCPITIYWRIHLFFLDVKYCLYNMFKFHMCLHLFMDSVFSLIDCLFMCQYVTVLIIVALL